MKNRIRKDLIKLMQLPGLSGYEDRVRKDLNQKLEAIESKIDNLNKNNKSFLDLKNITLDHNNVSIKFKNRDDFLSLLENTNSILEIGPFDKPSIEKFRRENKIISLKVCLFLCFINTSWKVANSSVSALSQY